MKSTTPYRSTSESQTSFVSGQGLVTCRFSVGSLAGRHSVLNQDSYACRAPDFFAVADGVGGGCFGEIASSMLVSQLSTLHTPQPDQIAQVLTEADTAIAQRIAQEGQGPGAAVCAAVWCIDATSFSWLAMTVGDCQVMVLASHGGDWHIRWSSPLQTYAAYDLPPPTKVSIHAPANMVGCGMSLPAQFHPITLVPGERLLLCSDGFHQVFSEQALEKLLSDSVFPLTKDTAQHWCHLAQQAGAQDDVTVIMVEPVVNVSVLWHRWVWATVGLAVVCFVFWEW